ncbi:hypothetical protein HZB06_01020 [Candidatus Wolfebacteria bacterium]|nr:hypothetical protein [Candidatus Wolfebacteria bacterium]
MKLKYYIFIAIGIALVFAASFYIWGNIESLKNYTNNKTVSLPKNIMSSSSLENISLNQKIDHIINTTTSRGDGGAFDTLERVLRSYYYRSEWQPLTGKFKDIKNGEKITSIETKLLANGDILIKEGPELINYGSNSECGACTRIFLGIYHIRPSQNTVRVIFTYEDPDEEYDISEINTHDIFISDNWDFMNIFVKSGSGNADPEKKSWYFRKYCLIDSGISPEHDFEYKGCAGGANVPEPKPRSFIYDKNRILKDSILFN